MTIYFAGGSGYEFMRDKPMLESFWYKKNAQKAMQMTSNFFLDSGAFSAFTQNAEIDIELYAAFIRENIASITIASSLDAIGDAKKSWSLYNELIVNQDCDVIPVFHCREDIKYLKKYLRLGIPYIALGGMVPESTAWLYSWLDDLWANYLTDNKGAPIIKVHGFGLTVSVLIERYPWFSVDSTTWLNGARFGTAIFNFEGRRLVHVPISERNPAAKQIKSMHIDNLTHLEKESTSKQFSEAGISLEDVRLYTEKALEFNAWSFLNWEKRYGFPKTFSGSVQESLL